MPADASAAAGEELRAHVRTLLRPGGGATLAFFYSSTCSLCKSLEPHVQKARVVRRDGAQLSPPGASSGSPLPASCAHACAPAGSQRQAPPLTRPRPMQIERDQGGWLSVSRINADEQTTWAPEVRTLGWARRDACVDPEPLCMPGVGACDGGCSMPLTLSVTLCVLPAPLSTPLSALLALCTYEPAGTRPAQVLHYGVAQVPCFVLLSKGARAAARQEAVALRWSAPRPARTISRPRLDPATSRGPGGGGGGVQPRAACPVARTLLHCALASPALHAASAYTSLDRLALGSAAPGTAAPPPTHPFPPHHHHLAGPPARQPCHCDNSPRPRPRPRRRPCAQSGRSPRRGCLGGWTRCWAACRASRTGPRGCGRGDPPRRLQPPPPRPTHPGLHTQPDRPPTVVCPPAATQSQAQHPWTRPANGGPGSPHSARSAPPPPAAPPQRLRNFPERRRTRA
jgi:hypothetical protein